MRDGKVRTTVTLSLRPWRHYFDFRGRSRRLEWLLFGIVTFVGLVIVIIAVELVMGLAGIPFGQMPAPGDTWSLFLLPHNLPILACLAACFVPALALNVRRLHDIGLPGVLALVWLLPQVGPVLGALLAIGLIFLRGSRGENRYGRDPRDSETDLDRAALDEVFR